MSAPGTILEAIRAAEVLGVRDNFPKPGRLLELGGSNGFQARILADGGWNVSSIDLADRSKAAVSHFPVQDYDGHHIPFEDQSFDGVFSSNVLEHIPHLAEILAETWRVLRPGGVAVHLLPSPAWRFWTIVSHYPYLVGRLSSMLFETGDAPATTSAAASGASAAKSILLRAAGLLPHGEYPNALAELYYFSHSRWEREFRGSGFDIVSRTSGNLFYTGHLLFPALDVSTRRRLAAVLGSACHVFVLRKR